MIITLSDRLGRVKATAEGKDGVTMTLEEAYGFEDILFFDTSPYSFVEVQ